MIDVAPTLLDIPTDGPTIYPVGQVDVDEEGVRTDFVAGYQALSPDGKLGLGYALDWVRNNASPSPVSGKGVSTTFVAKM